MATVSYTDYPEPVAGGGVRRLVWTNLQNGNDGQWYVLTGAKYPDKSVHVYGTFGSGGTLVIEGSNQSDTFDNYVTLLDSFGNNLSFTAAGLKEINQNTFAIRPRVTGGDATTSLTVIICMRREFTQ
jgi:hypothetical protein